MRPEETVLFVCLHGSAKSLVAMEWFNRLARQHGSARRAISAGTEPDLAVPDHVIAGLAGDGFEVAGRVPRALTADLLAGAGTIVSFGPAVTPSRPGTLFLRWDDVPAVSDDFAAARNEIRVRVERLIRDTLAATQGSVLILTRSEVARLLPLADAIAAVEEGFCALALGNATAPPPLHIPGCGGGFHAKAAMLTRSDRSYVAVKINGNFPENPARSGLPTIQGALALFDGENGSPLAVMDSIEITAKRTAAATGVAARHLARPESRIATVCGCGEQGRIQLEALREVLPLNRVFAWDVRPGAAWAFAQEMSVRLDLEAFPVADLGRATRESDAIITCTTARRAFLTPELVAPGTFIAAVGADNPEKGEIAPALMARATVVADVLAQCVEMGDLHHAIAAGALTVDRVHAELADLVSGRRRGRSSPGEITIFDSTGSGIQDVAAAVAVYERARREGSGTLSPLGAPP